MTEWFNETVQHFLSPLVSLRHSALVPVLLPSCLPSHLGMHLAQNCATSGVSPFSPSSPSLRATSRTVHPLGDRFRGSPARLLIMAGHLYWGPPARLPGPERAIPAAYSGFSALATWTVPGGDPPTSIASCIGYLQVFIALQLYLLYCVCPPTLLYVSLDCSADGVSPPSGAICN